MVEKAPSSKLEIHGQQKWVYSTGINADGTLKQQLSNPELTTQVQNTVQKLLKAHPELAPKLADQKIAIMVVTNDHVKKTGGFMGVGSKKIPDHKPEQIFIGTVSRDNHDNAAFTAIKSYNIEDTNAEWKNPALQDIDKIVIKLRQDNLLPTKYLPTDKPLLKENSERIPDGMSNLKDLYVKEKERFAQNSAQNEMPTKPITPQIAVAALAAAKPSNPEGIPMTSKPAQDGKVATIG